MKPAKPMQLSCDVYITICVIEGANIADIYLSNKLNLTLIYVNVVMYCSRESPLHRYTVFITIS